MPKKKRREIVDLSTPIDKSKWTTPSYRTRPVAPTSGEEPNPEKSDSKTLEIDEPGLTNREEILRLQRALAAERTKSDQLREQLDSYQDSLARCTVMLHNRSLFKGFAWFERDVLQITEKLTHRVLRILDTIARVLGEREGDAVKQDDSQASFQVGRAKAKLLKVRASIDRDYCEIKALLPELGVAYRVVDAWKNNPPSTPSELAKKAVDEANYFTALAPLARLWEATSNRCDWIVTEAERHNIYFSHVSENLTNPQTPDIISSIVDN